MTHRHRALALAPSLASLSTAAMGVRAQTDVRVNCVAPGAIEVERTRLELPDYAGTFARMTPFRRVGYADDVADAVVFLASPLARFITGQTLTVDGGLFVQPPPLA